MRKRTYLKKRILALITAAALVSTGSPVYGTEFEDFEGTQTQELFEEESVREEITAPENKTAFEEETVPKEETVFDSDNAFEGKAELFSAEDENREEKTEGIRYIKGRPLTEEEREEQLSMMKGLTPLGEVPKVDSDLWAAGTYALYPSEFDARHNSLITIAKNQNPFGICWAFGMASLLETSMLSKKKGEYDLSEEHLAYFFANRTNDPLGNTSKDRNEHQGNYHEGGNDLLASIFLTTWSGMTTEANVPLPTDVDHVFDFSAPISPSKAYQASVYLKNASFSDYSVDRMKQMLMENNSVSMMYYMETAYYNPDTAAYSCPESVKTNHVSVVIGWDDHYSKKNFGERSGVTSDGAWIVKNSWGPKWGEDGFFYLSYEDVNISYLVAAEGTTELPYPNNYFYDGSSGMGTVALAPGQSVANMFTADAGKGMPEILGEVNLVTFGDNANYSIQIYTDIRDESNPLSGTPAYAKPVRFSQPLAGVQTISVPEVTLAPETKYSVVLRNEGVNTFKFCLEKSIDYAWVKCKADVEPGQGFWADSKGNWRDLYGNKVTPRIKAHTRTVTKLPAPVLKAVSKSYNKIGLTWNKIVGARGYTIYRTEAGKKKKLATVSSAAVSYLDAAAKTGVKYSYTIVPYGVSSGNNLPGAASKAVSAAAALNKPVFSVKASSGGFNRVSWKKVDGATKYRVYRKTPSGSWKLLTTVNSTVTKFDDKKITPLSSYIYTVKAYRVSSGKTYASKYTAGEVIKAAPKLQKVDSVKAASNGISIKWTPQTKSNGYVVYRKQNAGSWETIKKISSGTAKSYLDKTARKGVLYYYAIKSYVVEPYGKVYSKYTASSAVRKK